MVFFLVNVDLPGDLYVFVFENHKIAIIGVMTQLGIRKANHQRRVCTKLVKTMAKS